MPKPYWYYQIWIGDEKHGSDCACYEYKDMKLSEACDKAKLQFWYDHDYPSREPNWSNPEEIDFYISKVQRSQSEIQTIYTLGTPDTLEHTIKEAN